MKLTPTIVALLLASLTPGCGLDVVYSAGQLLVHIPLKPTPPKTEERNNLAANPAALTTE